MTAELLTRRFQESFRSVVDASGIAHRESGAPCLTVGVTSPLYGEGKTTVSMAVAGLLSADLNVDVALIDTDFETHSLGAEYELTNEEGIADVLAGSATLEIATHRVPGTRLDVVTAGGLPSDPGGLIRSGELARLVESLKSKYAYVVLDLPGMLASSSGRTVADLCDGVIVVAKANKTSRSEIEETLDRLTDVRVFGIVINRWESRVPRWLERALGLASPRLAA